MSKGSENLLGTARGMATAYSVYLLQSYNFIKKLWLGLSVSRLYFTPRMAKAAFVKAS